MAKAASHSLCGISPASMRGKSEVQSSTSSASSAPTIIARNTSRPRSPSTSSPFLANTLPRSPSTSRTASSSFTVAGYFTTARTTFR